MAFTHRIIRTPRVSERTFILTVESGHEEEEDEVPEEEGLDEEPQEETNEVQEEPEPEQRPSALEVEALVQERLKSFEERYQQEKENAYKSGFEDGRTQGLKEGRAESNEAIDRLAEVVEAFQEHQRALVQENEEAVVDLAVSVAQRIVGPAVQTRREPVLLAVSDCLGYLRDRSRVTVKVNPKDLEMVKQNRQQWLEGIEGIGTLNFEGDDAISRGGCVVETDSGDVDALIEQRLSMLQAALLEEVRAAEIKG